VSDLGPRSAARNGDDEPGCSDARNTIGQGDPRLPTVRAHTSPAERAASGKAARAQTPRSSHSTLEVAATRNPIGLLEAQARSRVETLVPIRYGRMLASPLAFFRGAAAVMANDLAPTPNADLSAQLSGDAHLVNFGTFASPERALVFDLNDFDETLSGPFEWDLKRLATSFEIAARDRNFDGAERAKAVLAVVRSYRRAMREFASMGDLTVWYARLDAGAIIAKLQAAHDPKLARAVRHSDAKALKNDHMRALAKLTHEVEGQPMIVSDPPLVVPLAELVDGGDEQDGLESRIRALYRGYQGALPDDRRALLERFHYVDLARKVVGVGSVGTRCWLLLMLGRDERDPLFLQIKEAEASVLEPLLGRSPFTAHGRRVVEGQRLMQAVSDIFLGWVHTEHELPGGGRDFYVRQLWDWKSSIDVETILPVGLAAYAVACGWTLARAHARSGDRIAIAAYLGKSDRFDHAVAEFATAYADLNERDHRALVQAVADRRITAVEEL
jgi:uncharacterized protein (DUF2252 family)